MHRAPTTTRTISTFCSWVRRMHANNKLNHFAKPLHPFKCSLQRSNTLCPNMPESSHIFTSTTLGSGQNILCFLLLRNTFLMASSYQPTGNFVQKPKTHLLCLAESVMKGGLLLLLQPASNGGGLVQWGLVMLLKLGGSSTTATAN